jgi:hypothetical protein
MKRCHKCGTPWEGEGSPGFKATCASCLSYLHSCKNCRLHDPSAHNECLSPTTEHVADREGPNYCDEFDFKSAEAKADEGKSAEDAWDRLFRKDE